MPQNTTVRQWDVYAGYAELPRYTVSATGVDDAIAAARRVMPGAFRVVPASKRAPGPGDQVKRGVRFLGRQGQDWNVVGRY